MDKQAYMSGRSSEQSFGWEMSSDKPLTVRKPILFAVYEKIRICPTVLYNALACIFDGSELRQMSPSNFWTGHNTSRFDINFYDFAKGLTDTLPS